ncbi:MAG: dihydrolipoamide acetyltransferase family protein [Nanoarchaeota archaeon]
MSYEFRFPDVGEGIQEGEIVKWLVKKGDKVKEDQVLGQIETDKAVVDMPSPKSGIILEIKIKEGETVKVGQTLVVIGEKNEKVSSKEEKVETKKGNAVVGSLEEAKSAGGFNFIQKGSQKQEVETGPKLLVKRKYDLYGYIDRIPIKGIRKTTAEKMSAANTNVAHVTHMDEAYVDKLVSLREKDKKLAKKKKIKLTFLPYIIKALIRSLKEFPLINSSIEDNEIIVKKYYSIGIAVDSEEGLVVPVVKIADQKDIFTIAKEIDRLADDVRKRKVNIMDLKGSTFTITNVGSIGGLFATPIVNYPETAIIALGRMYQKPVVMDNKIEIKQALPFSITFDHRVVDGAYVARFSNRFKECLGNLKF